MSLNENLAGQPQRFARKPLSNAAATNLRLRDDPVAVKFCRRVALDGAMSPPECEVLLDIPARPVAFGAGTLVCGEDQALRPLLFTSGWASLQRNLPDGSRRIFDFKLPGDATTLLPARPTPLSVSIEALTDVGALDIAPVLLAATQANGEKLRRALEAGEVRMQQRLYDHIVRLGRRTAYKQLAHLFVDLAERLGTCDGNEASFALPLTQEMIGDILGLTAIHVNRTLQRLRADRLVTLSGGWLTIANVTRLRFAAGLDGVRMGRKIRGAS
jgi:CRP-like cAMP-binding protein